MPTQPIGAKGVEESIEVDRKNIDALRDLEGFLHEILLYQLRHSEDFFYS